MKMKEKVVAVGEFNVEKDIKKVNRYLKKGYTVFDVTRIENVCTLFILSKEVKENE